MWKTIREKDIFKGTKIILKAVLKQINCHCRILNPGKLPLKSKVEIKIFSIQQWNWDDLKFTDICQIKQMEDLLMGERNWIQKKELGSKNSG